MSKSYTKLKYTKILSVSVKPTKQGKAKQSFEYIQNIYLTNTQQLFAYISYLKSHIVLVKN